MNKYHKSSIKGSVELCQARVSKLMGYPRRGVTVAGEPAGPDVFTPGAKGWTEHQHPIVELEGDRYATQVDDPDKVGDSKLLNDTELVYLRIKHATATDDVSDVIVLAEVERENVA